MSRLTHARAAFNRLLWAVTLVVVSPIGILLQLVSPRRAIGLRLASPGARGLVRAFGVEVDVVGRERLAGRNDYLFVVNHKAYLDHLILVGQLPGTRFVASSGLFRNRWLGAGLRSIGIVPIDRGEQGADRDQLDALAADGLDTGLVVFPEGHRARAKDLLPFKGGAFMLAIRTGRPIVPVVLHNVPSVMPERHDAAIPVGRVWPGRVVVEFLDPLPVAGLAPSDRHALQQRTRALYLDALRRADGGRSDRADLGPLGDPPVGFAPRPVHGRRARGKTRPSGSPALAGARPRQRHVRGDARSAR